jgi:hypothetical protein
MKGIDIMKNYKVIATREFKDSNETDENTGLKKERNVNDEFLCTKERYEFLKANNAVKLVEIVEEVVNKVVEEFVESKDFDNMIDKIVDEAVEKLFEEPKPKKKKSKKK